MIDNLRVMALIPARGGSKGIKKKNIYILNGTPLIAYTIREALKCEFIDDIIVSTDSDEIAQVAISEGANVPFLRPAEYATDQAKTVTVVIHAIEEMKRKGETYDILLLLQPTSPLRTQKNIEEALRLFIDHNCLSLASVCEVEENPILMRQIDEGGHLKEIIDGGSLIRRQDLPRYYRVNGSIYINLINEITADTNFNNNKVPYIMERNNSVDIDGYPDIIRAESILQSKNE